MRLSLPKSYKLRRKDLYCINWMELCNPSWYFRKFYQISTTNHYMLSFFWQYRLKVRSIITITCSYILFTYACNWSLTYSFQMHCSHIIAAVHSQNKADKLKQ